ncbi:MAG: 23S rRNA (guanosine(2251)-2'-O)-methyltransferase RlmB [Actinobacteria bacterium]|nr:23S rRNA (guanosine(2251)-2'-O)-methyltransferase RlmB [Actinomycetota bacterium]MBI3687462.1 23S rRNA (guanosine(2251)-2'-O)-methyltransferase RlmB [Actinomycetota bacterium]
MAGNSQRRGARRNPGSKKGAVVGSGGQRRRGLEGKGPTPRAEHRTGHPAVKRAAGAVAATARAAQRRPAPDGPELLVGRNPVAEALRAEVPATALYLALGIDSDERVTGAIRAAGDRGISILEVSRAELDRRTGAQLHQGVALQVPPYRYADPLDLLQASSELAEPALFVALDGVVDPRNLGAIVRSAAAFGANGVLVPERRAAGITAAAWRTSAGAAARLPVARVTNLVRTLTTYAKAGLTVVGLDPAGATSLDDLGVAVDPVVLVIGSEGRGLSRLVGETCDIRVSIPITTATESLNASVAAAIGLAEVARRRRAARRG